MKLSGWYRIGIVLSVLWCIFINGVVFYECNFEGIRNSQNNMFVKTTGEIIDSQNEFSQYLPHERVIYFKFIIVSMIIPVVLGWFLVITSIMTIKWIRKGFRKT